MKLSPAALTVAAVSLLSTAHAAPLTFTNGEISGRLHHRRGSDISDVPSYSASAKAAAADEALEGLGVSFEPTSHLSHLVLPRILNFIKRQVSSASSVTSSTTPAPEEASDTTPTTGSQDHDLVTGLMSPDYESYGFASESGPGSALAPVEEIKE